MNDRALIFAGVIIGLAIADQLISLHRLMKRRHMIVWDPLPLWVAGLVMVTLVQVWWAMAGARDVPLTIGEFLPMLVGLVFLFLLAAASLPDEIDADGLDLRRYYDDHRRYIWTLYSLALAAVIVTRAISPDFVRVDLLSVQNIIDSAVLAAMLSLIVVRDRRWHVVVLLALTLAGPVRWLSKSLG